MPKRSSRFQRLFWRFDGPAEYPWTKAANLCGAILIFALILYLPLCQLTSRQGWSAVWNYRVMLAKGWLISIGLSAGALVLSLLLGVVLALARRTRFLPLRALSRVYVELIRGTPLLVQILILYYGVFNRVGLDNRYLAGVLILAGFSGAYMSEIIRAGIEAIGKSQLDSARAIGLSRFQTYRYVIFPQAIRQMMPPMAGQFASLIKDSSLLSIIGLNEFTLSAQEVASNTYSTLESYIPLAIGYLVLTLSISLWMQMIERSHHFET